jgi:hypothetical protein
MGSNNVFNREHLLRGIKRAMYLQLKETKQLLLENTGVVVESGINNAIPILTITSQSNTLTDLGVVVNFTIEIYNSLTAKLTGLQPIKIDNYSVREEIVASFDTIPEGATSVTELILYSLYSYLLELPLILPNGDISEEKLYKDWELTYGN